LKRVWTLVNGVLIKGFEQNNYEAFIKAVGVAVQDVPSAKQRFNGLFYNPGHAARCGEYTMLTYDLLKKQDVNESSLFVVRVYNQSNKGVHSFVLLSQSGVELPVTLSFMELQELVKQGEIVADFWATPTVVRQNEVDAFIKRVVGELEEPEHNYTLRIQPALKAFEDILAQEVRNTHSLRNPQIDSEQQLEHHSNPSNAEAKAISSVTAPGISKGSPQTRPYSTTPLSQNQTKGILTQQKHQYSTMTNQEAAKILNAPPKRHYSTTPTKPEPPKSTALQIAELQRDITIIPTKFDNLIPDRDELIDQLKPKIQQALHLLEKQILEPEEDLDEIKTTFAAIDWFHHHAQQLDLNELAKQFKTLRKTAQTLFKQNPHNKMDVYKTTSPRAQRSIRTSSTVASREGGLMPSAGTHLSKRTYSTTTQSPHHTQPNEKFSTASPKTKHQTSKSKSSSYHPTKGNSGGINAPPGARSYSNRADISSTGQNKKNATHY